MSKLIYRLNTRAPACVYPHISRTSHVTRVKYKVRVWSAGDRGASRFRREPCLYRVLFKGWCINFTRKLEPFEGSFVRVRVRWATGNCILCNCSCS